MFCLSRGCSPSESITASWVTPTFAFKKTSTEIACNQGVLLDLVEIKLVVVAQALSIGGAFSACSFSGHEKALPVRYYLWSFNL